MAYQNTNKHSQKILSLGYPQFPAHIIGFALASAFIFLSFSGKALAQDAQPPVVEVATPISKLTREWDEYTGQFQAVESVDVRARVSGYIDSISFEEGELVERGDLLYTIDPRPFKAEVDQAKAQVEVADAQQQLASVQNERAAQLLERRVGSQADADEAAAQLAQANANLELAKARLQAAELNLEFTEIRAPISGRISATNFDPGNLITGTTGNQVLTNIVSLDPIEFSFTVSESAFLRYARLARTAQRPSSRDNRNEVQVKLSDEDDWERTGHMSFVDNQLDPNSGTMEGRALFPNDDRFLQPGIFGRLRLVGSAEYEALFIPDSAILSDQSSKISYVVNDENIVEQRIIQLGPLQNGLRIVRSGLMRNDRVIIRGIQRARPGQPVTPQDGTIEFAEATN